MCYPCKNCGHCELRKPKPLGYCPFCGFINDPFDSACAQCGEVLPPRPGQRSQSESSLRTMEEEIKAKNVSGTILENGSSQATEKEAEEA